MLASPRFVDGAFRNSVPRTPMLRRGSGLGTVGDFLFGGQRRTPPAPLPSVDPRPAWQRPPETGLRATWLGHSTVLVEIDGLRVLTDPVWGERASPSRFAGPKRFQPVPVPVGGAAAARRGDHLARSLRSPRLPDDPRARRADVPFFTSLGVGAHLESWGVAPERIIELDWWESGDAAGRGAVDHRGAVAALLRARRQAQHDPVVVVRRARPAPLVLLQRRHRPHPRVRRDRARGSARSIW